jgi:hypothetical protein
MSVRGAAVADGSVEETRRRVESVPVWFHSIDVDHGVVTPGLKTARQLEGEIASLRLPT